MANIEPILGLLVAIAVLAGLARVVGIPYPVVLLLGGLAAHAARCSRSSRHNVWR